VGDGTGQPRVLAGGSLTNFDAVREAGAGVALTQPVRAASAALTAKLYALSEEGQTALGPAVLAAVAMAARTPGSRVVVCTDGVANVGLGSLEPPEAPRGADAEAKAAAAAAAAASSAAFYTRVAELAVSAGVVVDVVGFEGAGCNLEALGQLAQAAGGDVTRVNPATIVDQFAAVLEAEVVASACVVTVTGHVALSLRDPASDALQLQPAPQGAAAPAAMGGAAPAAGVPAATPAPGYVQMVQQKRGAAGKMAPGRCGTGVPVPAAEAAVAPAAEAAPGGAAASATPAAAAAGGAGAPAAPAAPAAAAADAAPGAGAGGTPWQPSQLVIPVGNVTRDTEVSFTYRQKAWRVLSAEVARAVENLTSLPFQVAIQYTRRDGAVCLRVITSAQRVTEDAAVAVGAINTPALVSHAAKSAAVLARGGRYEEAAAANRAWQSYLSSNLRADDRAGRRAFRAYAADATAMDADLEREMVSEQGQPAMHATPAPMMMMGAFAAGGAAPGAAPPAPGRAAAGGGPLASLAGFFGRSRAEPVPAAPTAASAAAPMVQQAAASAAMSAESRVARRAGNDDMASRLYQMSKGGKKYSKAAAARAATADGGDDSASDDGTGGGSGRP
jgi:hypothetical protein